MDSIMVIITMAPYGREDGFNGLYLPIVTIAAEIGTQVLLIDDGVFCGLSRERSRDIRYPSISELVAGTLVLDGKVYADARSCEVRGVRREELIDGVELTSYDKVAQMLTEAEGTIVI